MSRNSKSKRDAKKNKTRHKSSKEKSVALHNLAPTPPVAQLVPNPLKGISDEERIQVITEIGTNSRSRVDELLESLTSILKVHDPIQLLSILSAYGLTIGIGDDGATESESQDGINQAHVELLQALALSIPPEEIGIEMVMPELVQQVWEELMELEVAFRYSRLDVALLNATQLDKAIYKIQETVRSHTQFIRNWGFHSQILTISKELYSHFDSKTQSKFGYTVSNIIDIFKYLLDAMEEKLTVRRGILAKLRKIKKPQAMLDEYFDLIQLDESAAQEFKEKYKLDGVSAKKVFIFLMGHFDLSLEDIYRIEPIEISESLNISTASVKGIISYFSLPFGELTSKNKHHFFLDNPVWKKPIIACTHGYYCVMPQMFFSFVLSTLDEFIEVVLTESSNKEKLYKRRADYLELKIAEIVKRRFPKSKVISNLKWSQNEDIFENDLVAFIDSYAIIIEAKSQKISSQALRGAPATIKRHLKDILIEPGLQSRRLELKLNELQSSKNSDDPLIEKLPVSINNIHKIIRVSVSLEYFSTLQANLRLFSDTGWIPSDFVHCPSMNLADFETLFDFLEHPVQIIHYLLRRTEIETKFRIKGDELDYMGFYISSLFDMGETDQSSELIITGMSRPLDLYYISKDEGISIPKPKPATSKFFNDIFRGLEERSTPRWSEIGCILNHFPPYDQHKISKAVEELKYIVNMTWQNEGHKNMLIYEPPKTSEYALAIILFKTANQHMRYDFVDHASLNAMLSKHVKACLAIAINIDRNDMPYHYLALIENKIQPKSLN